MRDLIFRGTVDEIDVGRLKEGMPVTIKIGALPSASVKGRLDKIWLKAHKQRSEEHTSELQSPCNFVCRLLLEKKKGSELRKRSSRPPRRARGYSSWPRPHAQLSA